MIRRPPPPRTASTLLEVLIGLGILGIAVTSIISLFPFAALTIAKALKDDRGTTAAVSGDAIVRAVHKTNVVEVGDPNITEPYYTALDNPAGAGVGGVAGLTQLSTTATTPSYPVYLDPMGIAAGRGAVGDSGAANIARVTFQFVSQSANPSNQALRVASQLDGLNYNSDGIVPGGYDMRELRYNMAWMLQRPSNQDRYTVRQQVVVYDRRVHLYAPPGSEAVYTGLTMTPSTSGNPNTTIPGVPTSAEIRKGTWVLDAGNPTAGVLQAEFYRVVSATDQGNGTYTLEVHKPIARFDGSTAAYTTTLVVMPAVCDVFERPPLTAGVGP